MSFTNFHKFVFINQARERAIVHGFCYGRKLKFIMKEVIIMTEETKITQNTTDDQVSIADACIKQAKEFTDSFSIESMPTDVGRNTETAMKWILDAAEHGIDILSALAINAPDYNREKVVNGVKQLCSEYNARAKHLHYNKLRAANNPIMAAVDFPDYEGIKYSEGKDDDDTKTFGITSVNYNVDLETLHKHCKKAKAPCGVNSSWHSEMNTLLMNLDMRGIKEKYPDDAEKAKSEAIELFKNTYKIKEIASKIGTDEDSTTTTKLMGALSIVIADMVGEEFKPLKCDVRYLLQIYCAGDKKTRGTKYVKDKEFSGYMIAVLQRVIKGKPYANIYNTKKK